VRRDFLVTLHDQTALVTGAGRGIGRATALALARAGARVAVNDLDPATAAATAAEIRRLGGHALALPGDVRSQDAVEGLVAAAVAEWGRLDVAVANAYFSAREPFWQADMDGFRRTIDVTMWGAFYTLRAAARRMIGQGRGGAVVLIGSPHAVFAVPLAMAYNMAKAAVDHMARTAAIELAEHRVRVNVIHPGWTDTPGEREHAAEGEIDRAAAKLPWKRLCRPEEVARGVVFLCEAGSDYITGSTLTIDGGVSLPWWSNRGSAVPE
jgi:glucose 1-dehydrogenase